MFKSFYKFSFLLVCVNTLFLVRASYGFDFEDLTALIKDSDLTSIAEVIERLPKPYLENFTLAYGSESLHGSSYDSPRAVLFGTDATLVITFNGDPHQSRYKHLEIMQYRQESNEFEMRSISFEGGIHFSAKNPPLCQSCHGHRPRPIWSSYEYADIEGLEHWPGFYGSTHDAPTLNPDEEEAYDRFRKLAADHSRYRHLRLDHPDSEWFPYGAGPYEHRFRPNNRLGNLLARLNAKRVAKDLVQKEFFRGYPNISLQWLLQCEQAEEESYLLFIKSLYDGKYQSSLPIDLDQYQSKSVEQVAFVFEKLLSGLDVYTWNLSVEPAPDDRRFSTGIVTIDELVAAVVLEQLPASHWLSQYYLPWTSRQLYETFEQGYYFTNVAPGGVGRVYDTIGQFFDRDRARHACAQLEEFGLKEAGLDSGGYQ